MTEAQESKFFFPAWYACVRANRWRMQDGEAVINEERLQTEYHRQVLALARQRAQSAGRPVNLEDLRHGAHIRALKRDKSHKHFTNPELDRVVCLFHVLEDPDWLGTKYKSGMMQWLAYERGEDPGAAVRVDWFLQHAAPDAYTRAISRDKFGTPNWEALEPSQKNELARTINERRRAKERKSFNPQYPKPEPVQGELVGTGTGPKVYQMNPHKVYTKGPF